jgi:hypothetical protein
MAYTTLSPKHQTTVSMEFVKQLGLAVGTRFKQWVEGNRIIMEPVPDIMDSFGSLANPNVPYLTSAEIDAAMELAVAREVMGLEKGKW